MSIIKKANETYMREALKEAHKALEAEEVPVGSVIVCGGQIIARGHNQTERLNDVTAHAEILALTSASHYLGSKYLEECTLFVTLEPCMMCAAAMGLAHIPKVVWGAPDPKMGYVKMGGTKVFHPKARIFHHVLDKECGELIKVFFQNRRD